MKTVLEMARAAGAEEITADVEDYFEGCMAFNDDDLERFVDLIRADAIADEREECAKVCEKQAEKSDSFTQDILFSTSATIRARSNT